MKKIIIMIVAVFATFTANAQHGLSKLYVGGGISFESTSDETAIAIIPELGYHLSDKWGIGARLGYGSQGSGDSKYTVFSIKPYVRHNVTSLGKIGLILDYHLLYQNEGIKDNKTNTFGFGVAPGLALNLNSRLSVVTHLGFIGYTSSKLDVEGAEATNKFTLNANSENISLSLYYNF